MLNPSKVLFQKITNQGGFVNAHAHFDRAFSVNENDFASTQNTVNSHLFEKWELVDKFKKQSSEENYFKHIKAALINQKEQGVQACLSFIDCDPIAQERALQAALLAKKFAQDELKINFLIACQTLKGVLQYEARTWFEKALSFVDIIGGLPGADAGKESEHLDVLFDAAKKYNKRVHVHVDQLNSSKEKETELLARKVMQWGLEGMVSAVHGISIAAHPKSYRKELYKMCKDANLSFIACPTAWIDSRREETLTPTHNAITPIDELIPEGITVAIGTDNISDIYKPFSNGCMQTELKLLLEATHFYDMDELVKIATTNGLKVLGL